MAARISFLKLTACTFFWHKLRQTLSLSDGNWFTSANSLEKVFVDLTSVELEIKKAQYPHFIALEKL